MRTPPDPAPIPIVRREDASRQSSAVGASVLILDTEATARSLMQRGLARHFALVEAAASRAEAESLLRRCHFDIFVVDVGSTGKGGLAWVEAFREQADGLEVIFIAADVDVQSAIAALRAGASDFILKPLQVEQLLAAAKRAVDRHGLLRESPSIPRDQGDLPALGGLVGECPAMHEVCGIIQRIAPMPSTVLIEGESGTGKELAARAIHSLSQRRGDFVAINCGAVSAELIESELFGHVKGAFTGAHQARVGLFGFAEGGTLFLDEISELPLAMQAKLLRVLEERKVRPVGGNQQVPVDVRIVAATNRTLADEVAAGRFREDLFYRLNVVTFALPPLRERREDVVLLVRYFLDRLSAELGVPVPPWDDQDIDLLKRHNWPGNVRELRNVIERCLLLGRRPADCIGEQHTDTAVDPQADADLSLAAVERAHILRVLGLARGNKSEAGRRLGISRKTLERKLKDWAASAPGKGD